MHIPSSYLLFATLTLSLLVQTACTSTKLTSVRVDEDIGKKRYHHMLVLGVADRKGNRMDFEDYFTDQIKAEGVKATQSYKLLHDTSKITRESIAGAIKGKDIDSILVTHMVAITEEEYYIPSRRIGVVYGGPGYYDSFYNYYLHVHTYVHLPSYYNTHDVVTLETSVFDLATGKRLWQARSTSFAPDSVDEVITELVELVINDLKQRQLIE